MGRAVRSQSLADLEECAGVFVNLLLVRQVLFLLLHLRLVLGAEVTDIRRREGTVHVSLDLD